MDNVGVCNGLMQGKKGTAPPARALSGSAYLYFYMYVLCSTSDWIRLLVLLFLVPKNAKLPIYSSRRTLRYASLRRYVQGRLSMLNPFMFGFVIIGEIREQRLLYRV